MANQLITADAAKALLDRSIAARYSNQRISKDLKWANEKMYMLQHLEKTAKLRGATGESIVDTMLNAAAIDLSLNPALGHAYPVPMKNEALGVTVCTLWVGYQGMEHTLYKSGAVKLVEADIIWSDDVSSGRFEYELGTSPWLKHNPLPRKAADYKDDSKAWGAYAIFTLVDGTKKIIVLDRHRILLSKAAAQTDKFWEGKFWFEMWKKTAVRAGYKHLPKVPLIAALETTMRKIEPMVFDEPTPEERKRAQSQEPVVVIGEKEELELDSMVDAAGITEPKDKARWLAKLAKSFGHADPDGHGNIKHLPMERFEDAKTRLAEGLRQFTAEHS